MNARDELDRYIETLQILGGDSDNRSSEQAISDVSARDHFIDAYRAEVLAEAHGEVVAWLEKKASEHHAQGRQYAKQAGVIWRLADKVSRGAVRVFPYKPRRQVEDVRADEIGGASDDR
ncbi:hypothetical protein [Streptomyces phytophilus]|uniref:hypothetical protein n=1 Tax=Streptomyces phytophilus TaxID=722715 RepID=UPI0015F0528A|nr:hypothetical protein [Streptomyces phytophilus]